jgi:hypothetical protein
LCEWGQESRATEGERGDRNCVHLMMAFSRAFIAGENLVAVTLVNSPTLTFLVLRACGTGLRAGKVSILRDFTWINLWDALLRRKKKLGIQLVCYEPGSGPSPILAGFEQPSL